MLYMVRHDAWMILFVALILIGILAGQGLVVGFGAMGMVVRVISWLWNRVSLEEVSYERRLSDRRVFMGDEVSLTLTLTNRKPVPLGRIKVDDEIPKALDVTDAELFASPNRNNHTLRHSTSMSWYERIRWDYRIKTSRRGLYSLGPARMESGDLFGFFSSHKLADQRDRLLVYPRVVPLPDLGLPAARPLGEAGGGLRIFPDPSRPAGIREYQPGDPLKAVHWKATARTQRLQVRIFEPSSTTTVILVVVVETAARHWEGYSPTNLEYVITAAASVASYVVERQYSLGLFSNGAPILKGRPMRIAPSRSPGQLSIILEVLATIRPMPLGPMSQQLGEHVRRFPIGATLVFTSAVMPPEMVEVIGSLRERGHRIVVLYVGDGPCPKLHEGVVVHEMQDYFARLELASGNGTA